MKTEHELETMRHSAAHVMAEAILSIIPDAKFAIGPAIDRSERMNLKIRQAQLEKINYMVILGDKEVAANTISVRKRSGEQLPPQPFADFIEVLVEEITEKKI